MSQVINHNDHVKVVFHYQPQSKRHDQDMRKGLRRECIAWARRQREYSIDIDSGTYDAVEKEVFVQGKPPEKAIIFTASYPKVPVMVDGDDNTVLLTPEEVDFIMNDLRVNNEDG